MQRSEIIETSRLDPSIRSAWNTLRANDPVYASPYFAPEFAEAVASVTRSARLLVVHDQGAPVAFLPFHQRFAGLCGPIGGHLNDIHGLINGRTFDPASANVLENAGLQMLSLRHAPIGRAALGARFGNVHAFYAMDLTGGYAAYEARRAPFAKSAFRALRTRSEKRSRNMATLRISLTTRIQRALPA